MIAMEAQNQVQFDTYEPGKNALGPYTAHIWKHDPRHLGFLLARYKFVAKMLEGQARVACEIGCGDGFGMPVVRQAVPRIVGFDFEPLVIEDCLRRLGDRFHFACLDITQHALIGPFDAAYSLDVLEHIPLRLEAAYMRNICSGLAPDGIFVCGTPNETARAYASKASQEGHINLKTHSELRALMRQYFRTVFMFGMNDEVVHLGYGPMAHYLLAVGVGVLR
jgi:2-polyprenyl-3-methyl-5-hydroxy-6-metoxy-1,4-benzoquinol methylase